MEACNVTNKFQERLSYQQVLQLNNAWQMPVEVNGRGNFPTLEVRMQDLVQKVYYKLQESGIPVHDVRVNGGVATQIIAGGDPDLHPYNDIDLIFSVTLESEAQSLRLKDYVLDCLMTYLPKETNTNKLSNATLTDAYLTKLLKIWQTHGDKWTLVSLSNPLGMHIELKFVDTMKRKYQFSVDSFQIILDSLMQFYDFSSAVMSEDFYPTVFVESVYGDYKEAVHHLHNRIIATHNPQEVRGGGLLKYCTLLARGYKPAYLQSHIETMERLMCSRFFIDYSDIVSQQHKLGKYLCNHFKDNLQLMLCFLVTLYDVVNNSTVCLMGHERRLALDLIVQYSYSVEQRLRVEVYVKTYGEGGEQYPFVSYDHFQPNCYPTQPSLIYNYQPYPYMVASQ